MRIFGEKAEKTTLKLLRNKKSVLANVLCIHNYDVMKFCDERPGMIAEEVQKWVNNVKKEKDILDKAGRPSALTEEAKTYIKSLINVNKPETVPKIIELTQDWLRLKGVNDGSISEHSKERVVSDKTIRNFLNQVKEKENATLVVPDSTTRARDRETKDSRNVLSWAALVLAYCKDLYPQLVSNWDATSLKFGDMIDGNDDHKVLVFALDLKKLKLEGKSLKAQVASDFENAKGVFVKKYHYTNSAGQKAPLTYLIEDNTLDPKECLWYKINGLSCDNGVGGYGYVAFCYNRSGSEKFFEYFIDRVVSPFVTACQASSSRSVHWKGMLIYLND